MSYVTVTVTPSAAGASATATVPALSPGVTRTYRIRSGGVASTTTQIVVDPVSKTVPGAASSAVGGGKRGSQPATQERPPTAVKRRNAWVGGSGTARLPVSTCRVYWSIGCLRFVS